MVDVVVNTRSNTVHSHMDCGSVKQMKEENKSIMQVMSVEEIEGQIRCCKHCINSSQRQRIMHMKYESELKRLKEQYNRKVDEIMRLYRHEGTRDEAILRVQKRFDRTEQELKSIYGEV
ncbi:MAG: hypothetical protein BZ138_05895 [Methanosphaera sp. rholeuAM270]|nr:MAG: hypothetical protein BZ138_05895 [Methanosphaera sp. rholeuAM270]